MGSLLKFLPGDFTKTITMSPVLMALGVVLTIISAVYTLVWNISAYVYGLQIMQSIF